MSGRPLTYVRVGTGQKRQQGELRLGPSAAKLPVRTSNGVPGVDVAVDRPALTCSSEHPEPDLARLDTNAIESLNARFRKAAVRRGHFPTDQAALKVLYLVSIERQKNRANPTGRINGWKHILNTLTIHYNDRITAVTN